MGKEKILLSHDDLIKLIENNHGTANGLNLRGFRFDENVDLSGLDLSYIDLSSQCLRHANFNGSMLKSANFTFATLEYASFNRLGQKQTYSEGARFAGGHLDHSEFREADLSCITFQDEYGETYLPSLNDVDFRGAKLFRANFDGCYFYGTKLEGAFVRGTELTKAHIESADWGKFIIGEEITGDFQTAEYYYRILKVHYANLGFHDIAARFYYREKEVNRKSIKLNSSHWNDRLATEFFRALFGYGERWWNVVFWIIGVILLFSFAYSWLLNSAFGDSLYFSAVSFIALGYGSWVTQDVIYLARIFGVLETFIGFFLMTLLLTTFVRKWTR
jgi:hypothetical protein